jgi:hypothetical protein
MAGRRKSSRRGLSYLPSAPARTSIILYLLLAGVFLAALFYTKNNIVKTVNGQVVDAYTGQPVVGATVVLENDSRLAKAASISQTLTLDSNIDGKFEFAKATDNYSLSVKAPNYRDQNVQFSNVYSSQIQLVPSTLRGIVRDEQGRPIINASVTLADKNTTTNRDGEFSFSNAPEKGDLVIKAAGFKVNKVNYVRTQSKDVSMQPLLIKGIYVKAASAANPAFFPNVLNLIDGTELTTVVLEIKDSNGLLAYDSKVPNAKALPESKGKITNLFSLVSSLKNKGVYTVARLAVFQDATLSDLKPEWAVKSRTSGRLWADAARFNWMNPYNREVWAFNIAVAKELAAFGFDEVQLSFVHFPQTGSLSDIDYGRASDATSRTNNVVEFLRYAREQLSPLGMYISVEVLGAGVLESGDLGIGLSMEAIANEVDYLCPVLFPSYFGSGSFNHDKPATQPYDVISKSLTFAKTKLQGKRAQLRPWLQDFSAEGATYGATQVREQIRATEEFGKANNLNIGWLLWNNETRYTASALLVKPR